MHKFIFACCLLAAFVAIPVFAEVNINTASVQELSEKLKNVGYSKANAIVEYREAHGDFKSIDDLELVKGIGRSTIEMNRNVLSVMGKASPEKSDLKSSH